MLGVRGAVVAAVVGLFVTGAGAFPVARIDEPTELGSPGACVGGGSIKSIVGVAYDTAGDYAGDTLEVRPLNSNTWTFIGSGLTPVPSPTVLYNWSVGPLSEGVYVLRLTVYDIFGASAVDESVFWVAQSVDEISVTGPPAVLGGKACFEGTVRDRYSVGLEYTVGYRPAGAGPFLPVDPANPVYAGEVIGGTLATWDTLALPDGDYEFMVRATDDCGNSASFTDVCRIDNTTPAVSITEPFACGRVPVGSTVDIKGEVADANLKLWTISVLGGPFDSWHPIASGNADASGLLAQWDTTGLPACGYLLRLDAHDGAVVNCSTTRVATVYRAFTIGCAVDFNGDGVLNFDDLDYFIELFVSGQCE